MASFPTAVKSFTTVNSGDTIQAVTINDLQSEVNAIEAGYLNGTANLNSSASTMASLSVTGGSTLATLQVTGNSSFGSTVTFGTIAYIMPSANPASSGAALMVQSTGTPNILKWGPLPNVMTLIAAQSGTDVNVGASDVSSATISGLTAKDQLYVTVANLSSSQATGSVSIRHQTDGVNLQVLGIHNANEPVGGTVLLSQSQGASTTLFTMSDLYAGSAARGNSTIVSVVTPWTGTWSLALRHGGVTAGGTFQYRFTVYKIAGQ